MIEERKNFFERPSVAEILAFTNNREVKSDFWENISALKNGESLTLVGRLFPEKFDGPDEFLKNGPKVHVPTRDRNNSKLKPYELREIAFNKLPKDKFSYAGFTFTPFFGTDRAPRIIRLNDIVEAARIYAYAPLETDDKKSLSKINLVRIYDGTEGTGKIGATIIVKVPSRTKRKGKYEFRFDHVPVVDNDRRFAVAYMLRSDHVCQDKRYDIKTAGISRPEFTGEYRPDEHEIAAYYAIISHYLNLKIDGIKKPNKVPLEMNLFGVSTEKMSFAYDNMLNRVIWKETPTSKPEILDEGHLEVLCWEGVIKEGYRNCFFKDKGKVKDFDWTQYRKQK